MNLKFDFRTPQQQEFFWSQARNSCFSGGFGSGKSVVGVMRSITHCATFPNYRMLIARQTYSDLRETTMRTFFNFCPPELIKPNGHNVQAGLTQLINGSSVVWMHLDKHDEKSLRGLEVNSVFIDQAEEIQESIALVLDARVGRWSKAEVPKKYLDENPKWPRDKYGQPRVHNYIDLACNPDNFQHWIYRNYHPDSPVKKKKYFFIEAETDESMNDPESYQEMLTRDPEWVEKYMKGKWGASKSALHTIHKSSFLPYDKDFLQLIIAKGALYRAMDHGNTAPTCVLWVAAYKGVYIFYREYYVANQVVSEHRKAIAELTGKNEFILNNYADPAIFAKVGQNNGGFWTVADEYITSQLDAPPIVWTPADNNEFATRNRIDERLRLSPSFQNPVTGESPAPGVYFIQKSIEWPYGIEKTTQQIESQRKILLGSENGKEFYSDERDDKIPDHAYDPFRYFISMHGSPLGVPQEKPPILSFANFFENYRKRNRRNSALIS